MVFLDMITHDILEIILLINILFAISLIFFERRSPSATLAWLAVLFFIPVLGFILYLIFGQTFHREKMFKVKAELDKRGKSRLKEQLEELQEYTASPSNDELDKYLAMAHMLLVNDMALLSENNLIQVYTDGNDKFNALLDAIKSAKQHIHIEYYIIRNDDLGHKVVAALAEKAKDGVEVRLIYDGLGCAKLPRNFFKELTDAGGQVAGFFERKIPLLNIRVNYKKNYRDHRKIVVIDGTTGFVGGFNIGDEYLGKGPLGYWRDTHLKLNGHAVGMLQVRFFQDWSFVAKEVLDYVPKYFPQKHEFTGGAAVQIVSCGPDTQWEPIKKGFIALINSATKTIYIQSPYFVLDESVMEALKIAALTGVDVRIMIPCKPDHPFVYWTTYANIGELLDVGARAYTYDNGFIHSKTVVVDGLASSVGTANWDVRSFRLNFETNAFIYGREIAGVLKTAFENDINQCTEITKQLYSERSTRVKIKESISRLFSAAL
uniref:Cardiolipin synthase n=1 Tax=Candidatus Methanophaga sp. ANME-1 ERB7 TaxID=2759913 RepID=A0A7G9Z2W5_9EURY|nr:cardiolipin synthase [Methanosarcinales archaeon ANME-1 ERB7]